MTRYQRHSTECVAVVAALVLALAGCGSDAIGTRGGRGGMGVASSAPDGWGANASHDATDVMFVRMMIPHHDQAIEMSDLVLGRDDVDPRVSDLAERIKAAQAPEIDLMRGWLEEWGVPRMPAGGMAGTGNGGPGNGGMGMGGMLSEQELRALADAEGIDASRLFLEGMIEHHEGAIDMAQAELDAGQDPAVLGLARRIIRAQETEIVEMRGVLAEL